MSNALDAPARPDPLYRRLADHYLSAIRQGTLKPGDRMPSVRRLMATHELSLSTALQACRHLEDAGWLEARPRSGYFVRTPRAPALPQAAEPDPRARPDPSAWRGIHRHISSLIARSEQAPATVNLALAVGAPALYPGAALRQAMQRRLRQHPEVLSTMSRRHGHPLLQAALARYGLGRGMQTAPEDIIVTHGCIEALNLALRATTRPGDTVAVESPTFYGLLQVIEALGLRALEIPTSPTTGLSLEALDFALQADRAAGAEADAQAGATPGRLRAVVVMPTWHNPLGCLMPDERKKALVEFCSAQGLALIEDDIYADMGGDRPERPCKAWDRDGTVIWCHSLNKLLAPGLRLGWMLAGRWQARVGMLKYTQSRFAEALPQLAAADFIGSPAFERHLRQLRSRLRQQREDMADAVAQAFPAGTRLTLPSGGMLLWLQLPEAVHGDRVFEAALAQGIKLAPGSMFSASHRFDHCLRLSCAQAPTGAVRQALQQVGTIVRQLAEAAPPSTGQAPPPGN